MSVVSPWGFGVNRAEIQQLVCEIVETVTGLPLGKVFVTDAAARFPTPPRPWVSVQLGSPIMLKRTGNEERVWPTKERWTVTVNTVTGNPQRLTILGTNYDYTAGGGDTATVVRDGLLAAIGSPTGFAATAQGTSQILLASTLDGQRLVVTPGLGNDITAVRDVANLFIRNLRELEIQCSIKCSGLMDIQSPDATQGGQAIADLVEMGMSSTDITERMRYCGHVPVRISRVFDGSPLNDQQRNESTVQVIIATTGRMDVGVGSVTEINVEPTATQ